MTLVGFMQAGSTTVFAGSWRHPATEHGFLDASYYQKLGRTLEEGCFDLMFFDDRLAMPGVYGGSVAEAVLRGARPVKLDDLRGQVWIADFIFTGCQSACPMLTSRMRSLQNHLEEREHALGRALPVRLVSFSVDPEVDTPDKLLAYAYALEQAAPPRKSPKSTPPLSGEPS